MNQMMETKHEESVCLSNREDLVYMLENFDQIKLLAWCQKMSEQRKKKCWIITLSDIRWLNNLGYLDHHNNRSFYQPINDQWMDGWMDGRMDGWMDGWMDGHSWQCIGLSA